MAERLTHVETSTSAADSYKSERRKRFWNKVLGVGIGVAVLAEFAFTMLTPFKPLLTPLEIAAISKAASFGLTGGIWTAVAGGAGRLAAEFRKK